MAQRRHREVAQGQRRSVSRVGGFRNGSEAESGLHHLLHLRFIGGAPTGHCALHLIRGVRDDLTAAQPCFGQGKPTRLRNAHRGAHVVLKEHLLNSYYVRTKLDEQRSEFFAQFSEAFGQRVAGGRLDDAKTERYC